MTLPELFDRYRRSITQRDWSILDPALNEDAAIEQPFAVPGRPSRTQGREALRQAMTEGWKRSPVLIEDLGSPVMFESAGADALFVECEIRLKNTASGAELRAPFAVVVRARQGRISVITEYFNPIGAAQLVGAADALAAILLGRPASPPPSHAEVRT